MKTKALQVTFLLGVLGLGVPGWCADSPSKEDALYSDGTRAINDGRWAQAETIFANIAQQHGERAEAALYWQAYAENKEGKQTQALETCAQLRQAFPQGKWINECGALEIEIRGKGDDPLPPKDEQNEELKLLALNSLMQQDEARALPVIQQILNGDKSQKLKARALFVLAQDPSAQAQSLIGQVAHNDRDPGLQRKAIEMLAITRGKQAAGTLADVYRQSSNEQVKKTVLQTYLIIGTPDPLLEAARHESNPELVRTAVRTLGAMGAVQQMLALYRDTTSSQAKADIINGLTSSGPKGADALGTIAASEQDPELRRKAIRNLGIAGGPATAPSLVAIYKKSHDLETKKAVTQALFVAGDSHDLVELARAEKDPQAQKEIVQQLSVMHSKEASDYMLEILNK
ncbi:MAG: HEAT repeat domain-containing protein [Acidobacteriaceae bacterium]